jgi:hypothetical protein
MRPCREIWIARSEKCKLRKNEKHFPFYQKNAYFSTEIIKNFGRKWVIKLKIIVFLKEQTTGYLPMYLSPFRLFWRKLTFFEGGGGLKILYIIYLVGLDSPTWVKNDIYHDWFFAVYLLPCFEIKSAQFEFVICYATFNSLRNGKKTLKRTAANGCEKCLTLSAARLIASKKTTSGICRRLSFIKILF